MSTPVILPDSDPVLRQTSAPIETFDASLVDLAGQMAHAMLARDGVGLSAIQIGVPLRLIAVRSGATDIAFMANPVITRRLRRDVVMSEGCLSVPPFKWKPIARPAKCDVEWQELDGTKRAATFSGIEARIIQHEVDHLDGVLIIDLPVAA